jgi:hypothetical protein
MEEMVSSVDQAAAVAGLTGSVQQEPPVKVMQVVMVHMLSLHQTVTSLLPVAVAAVEPQ